MAGTSSNSSTLAIGKPEVETNNSIIRVPSKDMLQLMSQLGGCIVPGNKFDTGILSGLRHVWNVTFSSDEIKIRMDLQQRDNMYNRITLKPFYLELISNKEVKSRHEMHFQSVKGSVLSSSIVYQASWVKDGSWDETIDSVRIVVQTCRELAGTCYESIVWDEQSLQCNAALATYKRRDYKGLYLDTDLADVFIQCRGKSFPAHKMVLVNRSSVFKKMLSQDLETNETVTINDFDPEVIKVFLKFMYSGELGLMRESLCNSLIDLADIFQVEALRMLCEHQLTGMVTKENCVEYFQKSVHMNARLLKDKCWDTIVKNCKEVVFGNRENFKFFAYKFPDLFCELADTVGFRK